MKKLTMIATIITLAIIIATSFVIPASAACGFYAKEGMVTAWERIGDTDLRVITVTTEDGEKLDFYDDEDFYKIGDVVVLRMYDLSDEHEEEDEVTDVMLIERLDGNGMMKWFENKGL